MVPRHVARGERALGRASATAICRGACRAASRADAAALRGRRRSTTRRDDGAVAALLGARRVGRRRGGNRVRRRADATSSATRATTGWIRWCRCSFPRSTRITCRCSSAQRRARGWTGGIVTNPNCSTIVIAMVLGALRQFQPRRVMVTTLQALSGAGYPGVASLDALGNVIPYIGGGEEEKIETETLKLLGTLRATARSRDADFVVSAQTTRVPVPDGHTAVMSIELAAKPSIDEVSAALDDVHRRTAGSGAADARRPADRPAHGAGSAAAAARRGVRRRHAGPRRPRPALPDARLQAGRDGPQRRPRRRGRGAAERGADGRARPALSEPLAATAGAEADLEPDAFAAVGEVGADQA